ncbi:hypothetical protein LCI18_013835 [Fusarium solani-melongenae]|uniref:Uncharacterized protein n=1 Tax=Fusarium solani subsp. cucurbitae TaxID=2747967 RepID=A0ACD3ZNU2_FUSSC|nr:hypothetical protein LCI18_013835 [Fusarium solani-melongenae]
MSTTTEDQKSVSTSRRRSSKACLSCRSRKVRCDVTHKGRPCTNCGLDEKQCVVTRRGSYKLPKPVQNDSSVWTEPSPSNRSPVLALDELSMPMAPEMRIPLSSTVPRLSTSAGVTFVYYRFLSVDNIHNMLPADLNYVESQGCLKVPERSALDQLVQQYFRYVHPILPLMDEADFWDMYYQQSTETPAVQIHLVLLQAILFAACNYAPKGVIQALGFSTTQEARSVFYRRTKLLHDFEAESSLITRTQVSLLLAYWSPQFSSGPKKQNLSWLNEAFQNATSLEAHVQASLPAVTRKTHFAQWKRQNLLRRLWWCCIFCDRILPLNMRRSLHISSARFDFDASPALGYTDLSDELGRSQVYHAETKRRLADVVEQTAELCSTLTNVLELVYPFGDVPACQNRQRLVRDRDQIKDCKAAMMAWFSRATSLFPGSRDRADSRTLPGSGEATAEDPVRLYTNLMFMHYQTARLALCNHEILVQLACASVPPILGKSVSDVPNMHDLGLEVHDATSRLADCLGDLSHLGLVQKLPISGVTCLALPLLLSLVDVKLASRCGGSGVPKPDGAQTGWRHKTMDCLLGALRTFKMHFPEDSDYVIKASRGIVDSIQHDIRSIKGDTNMCPSPSQQANHGRESVIFNWSDILESQPGSYLHLIIAMDLSLSQRRMPGDAGFSTNLHSLRYSEAMGSFQKVFMGQDLIPTPVPSSHGADLSPSSLLTGSNLSPTHFESEINILYSSTSSASQDEQYSTSLMAIDDMMDRVPPPPQSLTALPSPSGQDGFSARHEDDSLGRTPDDNQTRGGTSRSPTTNQQERACEDWSQVVAPAESGKPARNQDWLESMLLEDFMMDGPPSDTRTVHASTGTEDLACVIFRDGNGVIEALNF